MQCRGGWCKTDPKCVTDAAGRTYRGNAGKWWYALNVGEKGGGVKPRPR